VLERIPAGREGDSNLTSTPDLFHSICELELMAEVRTEPREKCLSKSLESYRQAHSPAHETRRKAVTATGATQLEAFMCAHPALFPMTPRPCGKLNAYFAWKEGRAKAAR
jgi:hypothetical protein